MEGWESLRLPARVCLLSRKKPDSVLVLYSRIRITKFSGLMWKRAFLRPQPPLRGQVCLPLQVWTHLFFFWHMHSFSCHSEECTAKQVGLVSVLVTWQGSRARMFCPRIDVSELGLQPGPAPSSPSLFGFLFTEDRLTHLTMLHCPLEYKASGAPHRETSMVGLQVNDGNGWLRNQCCAFSKLKGDLIQLLLDHY